MNLIFTILASLMLLLGFISMVTPIPGGVLLISGGLTLLICSSSTARLCLRWIRSRYARFNTFFFWLENKVGKKIKVIGNALSQTQPLPEDSNNVQRSHREYINDAKAKLNQSENAKRGSHS